MPAFANVTINDGQTTPAAHIFYASQEEPHGVWNHLENSASNAIGFIALRWSLKAPPVGANVSSRDRVYRLKQVIAMPIMESTSASTGSGIPPAPTVAYTCISVCDYTIPERSTLLDRKNLNAYTKNALAHASWTAQAEQLLAMN